MCCQLGTDFLALLVPNLARLNDEAPPDASATAVANAESDASTIYHILGCLENFLALRPRMARDLASGQCLAWLMQRCRRKGRHDQNRGYAAELLAVLVQGEEGAYVCERLGRADGIDHLLEVLSVSCGKPYSAQAATERHLAPALPQRRSERRRGARVRRERL